MPERLVVIGGDAAGMSAASQARRMRAPGDLEIEVYERSSYVSYAACGEPYFVGGYVPRIDDLLARTPAEFARRGIAAHLRHEVTAVDTTQRRVTVRDIDAGRSFEAEYDILLYATGSTPNRPDIAGADLGGVHQMHTLDDALAVRRIVETRPERAVVVGGGYIGLEMAEAFLNEGLAVTVVTAGPSVLIPQLDPDVGDRVITAMRELGITVHTGQEVRRIEGRNGRVAGVRCCDEPAGDGDEGHVLPADVVVLGLGSQPVVDLARAAGIPLGESGAVRVDDRMRTRVPGVWAAGDCVEATHRVSGRPVNFHLGTIANKQGRIAGINIGGGDEAFPGVLGTAITKVCGTEVARTGLTEAAARDAGFDVVAPTFDSTTTAGYWPDAEPMTMKVVADRRTHRLLGAQIVGGDGAGKRIDAVAMALWNEMTVEAMVNVDLSYAPPFSGVWDPVLVAARKASDALAGEHRA